MHALRLLWTAHHHTISDRRRRRLLLRRQLERIEDMPELLFTQNFRLDKASYTSLCMDLRRAKILKGTDEIPLQIKVLCALSFFATGSYQKLVGVGLHLTQRTTSRCINEVVDALNDPWMVGRWIIFPQTPQERSQIKEKCICDADLKILSVNSKFGGSTHDSFIWLASHVESYVRGINLGGENVWLLGDSGYPLRPWLMTPLLNANPGTREERYTRRHVQARSSIERCFGLLKARWRCLLHDRVLHYHPEMASKIVHACCVLHNIALHANVASPPLHELPPDLQDDDGELHLENTSNDDYLHGSAVRSALINRMN
ncbi:putative nuclease HARBI1 [Aricia agestis]|uniref:putative nuclease HARBI1 n=1 Tax=Aricia agestis TaxID=91739 RepID=UPI001C20237F|nr:putative nuclease HARBI1 [Aricia agestis]XP_041970726.1 putative nuclease HARBI1 [Aricia agestis]